MNIDLYKPSKLPERFKNKLDLIRGFCLSEDDHSQVFTEPEVNTLIKELNNYCLSHRIIGTHYTRSSRHSIESLGLLVRTGDEIRKAFLRDHSSNFTETEIQSLKDSWDSYYPGQQASARDLRICFNLTEYSLTDGGAEQLLKVYGGEQIYMSLDRSDPLREKLGDIGEPLLVRCSLDPNYLKCCTEQPFGKVLVSTYHCEVNPEAFQFDQDAYLEFPVTPDEILEIRSLDPKCSSGD